ncbi:MAG: hypothetical protein LBK08_05855 [Treponema sp.]|jgi:hypothetical protein|nr:hypothetical protein [Treponema sp.]
MKKQKAELVTFAGLARRANVTPAAVSQFMRKQAATGSPVPAVSGAHRREKLVDLNHPLIRRYLENQTVQPSNRAGGAPPTCAALAKMKAQTEKTELSAGVLRGKYVDREFALQYLDELFETEKKELEAMVSRIIKQLAEEFGPADTAKIRKIRRTLEQPCNDALGLCRREIEKFRHDTGPRISAGEPAVPAPGGKRGKNDSLSRK